MSASPSTQLSMPPLTSAAVVLRTIGAASSRVSVLPHVVAAISDFLDHALPSIWSFLRACEANVLSLLPRLVARGIVVDVDLFFWKCQCGHLEILKWLHENRSEGCTMDAIDGAASCGYPDIVKFLHESRREGCGE